MTPYTLRDWPERLAIMRALESAGSMLRDGHIGDGFTAAIGRGRYGATVEAMAEHGFSCSRLYLFPLGTDRPAQHLRHDSQGVPSCCWLIADFQPTKE